MFRAQHTTLSAPIQSPAPAHQGDVRFLETIFKLIAVRDFIVVYTNVTYIIDGQRCLFNFSFSCLCQQSSILFGGGEQLSKNGHLPPNHLLARATDRTTFLYARLKVEDIFHVGVEFGTQFFQL